MIPPETTRRSRLDVALERDRRVATLGRNLMEHGRNNALPDLVEKGRELRSNALRRIRHSIRVWRRDEARELVSMGYRDLGEAGW